MGFLPIGLELLTYDQIVNDIVDVFDAEDKHATDARTIGSVQRTYIEAIALQIFKIHNRQRKLMSRPHWASASGKDLDDLAAGYGLTREDASKSSGPLTFYRSTATQPILIPAGTRVVRPASGSVEELGYYTLSDVYLGIGVASQTVDVEAESTGEVGNTGIRTITQTSVAGITGAYNPSEYTNGRDIESDDELRRRLSLLFASMQKATIDAIKFAAFSVAGVDSVVISENDPYPGYIKVYTSDENGIQTLSTKLAVEDAIEEYKAAGITVVVDKPQIRYEAITVQVNIVDPTLYVDVKDELELSLTNWLNQFAMGEALLISEIIAKLHESSNVYNVESVVAPATDIEPLNNQIIRPSSINVEITNAA